MTASGLNDLRVLIIEDESLLAMLIEDMLSDLGCTVVGVASDLKGALKKVAEAAFDAAIVDVNLNGARSFEVAEKLTEMRRPFVLSTGYTFPGAPATLQRAPTLLKPFREDDLRKALSAAVRARAA
jgi:CheY-like chemotaxis protein